MRKKIGGNTWVSISSLWGLTFSKRFGMFRLFSATWSFVNGTVFIELYVFNMKVVIEHDRIIGL